MTLVTDGDSSEALYNEHVLKLNTESGQQALYCHIHESLVDRGIASSEHTNTQICTNSRTKR